MLRRLLRLLRTVLLLALGLTLYLLIPFAWIFALRTGWQPGERMQTVYSTLTTPISWYVRNDYPGGRAYSDALYKTRVGDP